MKRENKASNRDQKKASRANDRSKGRAGLRAANQKAAQIRQHGGAEEHQADTEHLNMNRKPGSR